MKAIWELGKSVEGRTLEAVAFAPGSQTPASKPGKARWPWLLVVGGVHGDEIEGVWLTEAIREKWSRTFPEGKTGVILFANGNPDGVAANRRWNGNGVDLNRNLPSKDWTAEVLNPRYPPGPSAASEPETAAMVRLIAECKPIAILSAHSFSKFQVNANGPSREWAERLASVCGYPVTEDIGYPTPGSLGSYAGIELGIPTITLEIERGLERGQVLKLHLPVIEAALAYWNEKERNRP
jgi:protein MpaA